jgi:hypothetical protein
MGLKKILQTQSASRKHLTGLCKSWNELVSVYIYYFTSHQSTVKIIEAQLLPQLGAQPECVDHSMSQNITKHHITSHVP